MTNTHIASRVRLNTVAELDGPTEPDYALRLYREGQVSKSRAAEVAGVSLWEMIDWIEQAEIPSGYTLAEAMEELRRLMTEASIRQAS